jgi:pimeloyl-ACP methyl ester carboxylesterase
LTTYAGKASADFAAPDAAASGFASRWFTGEGSVRLHALVSGEEGKPPVVLLHGFPDFSRTWRHQLDRLAKAGHYAVAVDLRGAGRSSVPCEPEAYHLDRHVADVVSVLHQLRQDAESDEHGVALVAHDFGAHVAWLVAMRTKDLVRNLTVINGVHPAHGRAVGVMWERLRSLAHVGLLQPPGVAEALLTPEVLVEVLMAEIPAHAFTPADVAAYCETFRRPHVRQAMFQWYRQLARAVTCKPGLGPGAVRGIPVLTLFGASDPFLDRGLVAPPPSWVTKPSPRNLVCKGGHWLHWDDPDGCFREILGHASALASSIAPGSAAVKARVGGGGAQARPASRRRLPAKR